MRTSSIPKSQVKYFPFFHWPRGGPSPKDQNPDAKGRRMACKVLVGMQGRIDATRLFNSRLMSSLSRSNCVRFLWDRQLVCYHEGPLVKSDASLSEILRAIKGHKDSSPQSRPVGYALLGWHIDDGTGDACDVNWCLDHEPSGYQGGC